MDKNDIKNLAQQYLFERLSPEPKDPFADDESAFDKVYDITHGDPEKAWQIILELFQQAKDDKSLAYVAAGPLEDTISNFPDIIIDRVINLAKKDARFRKCLKGVWGRNSMPAEIRKQIDDVVANEPDW